MRKTIAALAFCQLPFVHLIAAEVPDFAWQIRTAVLAAPEEKRDDCSVLGYDPNGDLVTLREGGNELICLADDPEKAGFSVACYHRDLEPYMARGRELRAKGLDFKQVFDTREQEVKSGILPLPDKSVLNVLSGELDPATGEVTDTYLRYVIYIPFSTPESTGIPLEPVTPGAPWLMNPGTHRAHIMINPPKADE